MSYPFGPDPAGADKVALDLAEMANWIVHQPFFVVAEVLPLAVARVRRPHDAAFLLRALADRLDPGHAAVPVAVAVDVRGSVYSAPPTRFRIADPGKQVSP